MDTGLLTQHYILAYINNHTYICTRISLSLHHTHTPTHSHTCTSNIIITSLFYRCHYSSRGLVEYGKDWKKWKEKQGSDQKEWTKSGVNASSSLLWLPFHVMTSCQLLGIRLQYITKKCLTEEMRGETFTHSVPTITTQIVRMSCTRRWGHQRTNIFQWLITSDPLLGERGLNHGKGAGENTTRLAVFKTILNFSFKYRKHS